jgi:hypothetical protein
MQGYFIKKYYHLIKKISVEKKFDKIAKNGKICKKNRAKP